MEALRARLVQARRPVETALVVVIVATFVAEILVFRSPAKVQIVYASLVAAWTLFIAYEAVIKRSLRLGAAGLVGAAAAQALQAVPAYRWYGLGLWVAGVLGPWFLLWRRPVPGTEDGAAREPVEEPQPVVAAAAGEPGAPPAPSRPKPGDPAFRYPSPPASGSRGSRP